jgi:CBS domain-containing protein
MQIKDVMSHPAVTCSSTSTLDHAARLMWEYDCGIVPVVNDDGKLAGVVTDRDVCMAAYTQGKPLSAIPVGIAMAKQVIAGHTRDLVEQAEQLMRANQIRRLPVIDDDGRPIGVVSMNDLARLAVRAKKSAVDRELVQTMAAVCQPRAPMTATSQQMAIARPALAS